MWRRMVEQRRSSTTVSSAMPGNNAIILRAILYRTVSVATTKTAKSGHCCTLAPRPVKDGQKWALLHFGIKARQRQPVKD